MEKVHTKQITMKPRWHFILGSVFSIVGFVGVSVVAIYLTNLMFFLLRPHGPMGQWRLQQILESFPLWLPIFTVMSFSVGIWLLKKYEFSYKKNFHVVILGFIVAIVTTALFLDITGLSNMWFRRGPRYRYNQRNSNYYFNNYSDTIRK